MDITYHAPQAGRKDAVVMDVVREEGCKKPDKKQNIVVVN